MMVGIVIMAVLFLVLIGARLFVVVGVATMLCFVFVLGEGLEADKLVRIVNKMEGLTTKNVFLSIPLFVAAGTVMTRGGMARRLVAVARALVGGLPGGLAIAAVIACMIFAAISGSSPVTLVAVGTILYPALCDSGFPRKSAMGLLMTAGSLGCLLPPSIAMLIYAISVSGKAAVDPSELFLAGAVPALGVSALLGAYAFFIGLRVPRAPPGSTLAFAVKDAAFALVLPVLVVGGIYSGMFTPTEAGAVALGYSVIVCTWVYRELTVKALFDAFSESAILVGSLILIVVLAFGLNDFLAEIEAADRMGTWLRGAGLTPFEFLLVVNLALIFIGALMDSVSATLVFAPLLAPIALDCGLDPLHFGVIFVVNMEIGYLMPPVATNLFVGAAIFRRPFGEVARAVLPTLGIVVFALVIIMRFPTLSLGLVNLKNGTPFFASFPESCTMPAGEGDVIAPPGPASVSSDAGVPGSPKGLTMAEMLRMANQQGASVDAGMSIDAGAPDAAVAPAKPLSMAEMMKLADQARTDAGP